MSRKPAMSGDRRMGDMRRRVVERKKAVERDGCGGGRSSVHLHLRCLRSSPDEMLAIQRYAREECTPLSSNGSSQHPHIKVVVATPPHSPEMHRAAEHRSESPLMEAKMAREFTPKQPEPDSTSTSRGAV